MFTVIAVAVGGAALGLLRRSVVIRARRQAGVDARLARKARLGRLEVVQVERVFLVDPAAARLIAEIAELRGEAV